MSESWYDKAIILISKLAVLIIRRFYNKILKKGTVFIFTKYIFESGCCKIAQRLNFFLND